MANGNPSVDNRMKDVAQAVGERAVDKADEGRATAADRLENAASMVADHVEQLPGGPKVKEFAQTAADRLADTADYVRTHDAKRMMADVEGVVKNNPGPALVVAAAFGFLLGRALSRD